MAIASGAAAIFAWGQNRFDLLPSGFDLHEAGVLGSLTSVNDETIAVALAAGVAGMLALETRASSAVGVAISVTTIPAAAYLGVAAGLGESATARGALGVLGTNVAMMVVGAVATLALQSVLSRRPRRVCRDPKRSERTYVSSFVTDGTPTSRGRALLRDSQICPTATVRTYPPLSSASSFARSARGGVGASSTSAAPSTTSPSTASPRPPGSCPAASRSRSAGRWTPTRPHTTRLPPSTT